MTHKELMDQIRSGKRLVWMPKKITGFFGKEWERDLCLVDSSGKIEKLGAEDENNFGCMNPMAPVDSDGRIYVA